MTQPQTQAIRLHAFGAPEVMQLETIALPDPAAGEVQLRQTAIGFNYIDVYQRSGKYPLPTPTGLGPRSRRRGGRRWATGVTGLAVGRPCGLHETPAWGAYASHRNVPAAKVVKIPPGIGDEEAAAVFFRP
jgi:NADPH2:quinone reductase